MSHVALAAEHVQDAITLLGSELVELVTRLGVEAGPTVVLAQHMNTLTEVLKALGSSAGLS